MKVALITDTHWGVRNDSPVFFEYYKKFYENVFFPCIEELGINTVVMLGDTFDRRKYTNHVTIKASKQIYFDELKKRDILTHVLIGNHDTTFKNTNEVNTINLLLREYDNLNPISSPSEIELDGTKIAMIPWMCADNYAECMNLINSTRAEICMGHFEISGFEMHAGQVCHEGLTPETFAKFDTVFSGHYHHKSTRQNITYLGTPYEMTWMDYGDQKGFHIFDTSTRQIQFIANPFTMFVKVHYDDKDKEPIDLRTLDLKDCFVKLVVVNKTDYYKFDLFINTLYTKQCCDVKIIEDLTQFDNGKIDEEIDLEDTVSILSNYIDSVTTDIDKEKIKNYMKILYTEALNAECA